MAVAWSFLVDEVTESLISNSGSPISSVSLSSYLVPRGHFINACEMKEQEKKEGA